MLIYALASALRELEVGPIHLFVGILVEVLSH